MSIATKAVVTLAAIALAAAGWVWIILATQRPRPCRRLTAPGFELVEWRVQEPGTKDWARFRIEGGRPTLLGWEGEP